MYVTYVFRSYLWTFLMLIIPWLSTGAPKNHCEIDCSYKADAKKLTCEGRGISCVPTPCCLQSARHLNLADNDISVLVQHAFYRFPNLRSLDLSENNINRMAQGAFLGLGSLTTLDLQGNNLNRLKAGCFSGMPNLRNLNLADNSIYNLQAGAFVGLPMLMNLKLNENDLRSMQPGMFEPLRNLLELHLQNNQINSVLDGALYGMKRLKVISLSDNDLMTLPDLISAIPNLRIINLDGNPLTCDCHLEHIRRWFVLARKRGSTTLFPRCSAPSRVSGRDISTLSVPLTCRTAPEIDLSEESQISKPTHSTVDIPGHDGSNGGVNAPNRGGIVGRGSDTTGTSSDGLNSERNPNQPTVPGKDIDPTSTVRPHVTDSAPHEDTGGREGVTLTITERTRTPITSVPHGTGQAGRILSFDGLPPVLHPDYEFSFEAVLTDSTQPNHNPNYEGTTGGDPTDNHPSNETPTKIDPTINDETLTSGIPSKGQSTDEYPNNGKPTTGTTFDNPTPGRPDNGNPAVGNKPPFDRIPPSERPSNGNPSSGRPSNGDPSLGRPSNGNSSQGHPSNGNPSSGRPSNGNPSHGRPSNGNPSSGRPSNGNTSHGRPSNGNPSQGHPSNGNPPDERPSYGRPSNGNPTTENHGHGNPTLGRGRPFDGRPFEGIPSFEDSSNANSTYENGHPTNGNPTNGNPNSGNPSAGNPTYNGYPSYGHLTNSYPRYDDPTPESGFPGFHNGLPTDIPPNRTPGNGMPPNIDPHYGNPDTEFPVDRIPPKRKPPVGTPTSGYPTHDVPLAGLPPEAWGLKGSKMYLDCGKEAHQAVRSGSRVKWLTPSGGVVNHRARGRFVVASNGSLVVSRLQGADTGAYRCIIRNDTTTRISLVRLQVACPCGITERNGHATPEIGFGTTLEPPDVTLKTRTRRSCNITPVVVAVVTTFQATVALCSIVFCAWYSRCGNRDQWKSRVNASEQHSNVNTVSKGKEVSLPNSWRSHSYEAVCSSLGSQSSRSTSPTDSISSSYDQMSNLNEYVNSNVMRHYSEDYVDLDPQSRTTDDTYSSLTRQSRRAAAAAVANRNKNKGTISG